ncbi:MAG: helix-turn-helix transcriptional regulator [Mycobacterium sp.]
MNQCSSAYVLYGVSSASDITPPAEFLRSHRERFAPNVVGISTRGIRRVSGLRREEVATRAGISIEYYVRLEQGRERNPSRAVCDALAAALTLDGYETGHLHELAGPRKSGCGIDPPPGGSRTV